MKIESKFSLTPEVLESIVRAALGIPANAAMTIGGAEFESIPVEVTTDLDGARKIERRLRKLQA